MKENKSKINYKNLYDDLSEDLKLVKIMTTMKDCPVIKFGTKKIKMSYYLCSCDINQKDVLCEACANTCHAGHSLSIKYNYQTTKTMQVCNCGLKCHQLNEGVKEEAESLYQPICYSHELSINTKSYIYYQNIETENVICQMCFNICINDKKNWKDDSSYEQKIAENEESMPPCACPSLTHRDHKHILIKLFEFSQKNIIGNSITHQINLIIKSGMLFKNLFSSFITELEDLQSKVKYLDFEYDKRMNNTIMYLIMGNFVNLIKDCNSYYYFNEKLKDIIPISLIASILKKKVLDHSSIFVFLSSLLKTFQKFVISPLLEFYPKLKILDFINLSPFQRLILTQDCKNDANFKKVLDYSKSSDEIYLIDSYIICFESMIRQRFESIEGLHVLLMLTSFFKKFSKFYLFSFDQVIKLSSLIDDLFYYMSSLNKKLEKKSTEKDYELKFIELKIVTRILKIYIYFSFFYNDAIFKAYLNNKDKEDKANFIHTYNELGKLLSKNMLIIMEFIKVELDEVKNISNMIQKSKVKESNNLPIKFSVNSFKLKKTVSSDFNKSFEEIDDEIQTKEEENLNNLKNKLKKNLYIIQNLISIFLHPKDIFILTMKRSLNVNVDYMMRIVNSNLLKKESTFVNFIEISTKSIEEKYGKYFNYSCNYEELQEHISSIINSLFAIMYSKEYPLPVQNDYIISSDSGGPVNNDKSSRKFLKNNGDELDKILKNDNIKQIHPSHPELSINQSTEDSELIPFNLLIGKSEYIFSLVKIFSIQKNIPNKISPEFVNLVMKNLYLFIDNQPDNCLFMISNPILTALASVPKIYVDLILDFITEVLKIILKHKYPLHSTVFIKNYAVNLCYKVNGQENMYLCLLKMLKILEMLCHIITIYPKETLNSVRRDFKKISKDFEIFDKYKLYLMKLSEDRMNEKSIEESKDFNNNDIFYSIFKQDEVSPVLALKIYFKYVSLMNIVYDDNSLFNITNFLSNCVLNSKDILNILKNKFLDLQLRTELLKFYRMVYIDLTINENRLRDYRKVFSRDYEKVNLNETLFSSEEFKVFLFQENLVKVSGLNMDSKDSQDEYEILSYELENLEDIINSKSNNDCNTIRSYFENGLILPLKIYLNKVFSIVMNMSGKDFLKIYTLSYHILCMKKFILQKNYFVTEENKDNNPAEQKDKIEFKPNLQKKISVLRLEKLDDFELTEVEKDIDKITDPSFKVLDYLQMFGIIKKHLLSFIKNPSSKDLAFYFSNWNEYQKEKMVEFESNLKNIGVLKTGSVFESRMLELINIYPEQKLNFDNFCMKSNLNENHLDLQSPFRNVLLKFLFYMSTSIKDVLQEEIYETESNEIILKLLIIDTGTTQKAVEEMRSNDVKNVDLSYFAEMAFKNLLAIIFSQYNPTHIELSDEYYITCRVIKTFKFLCEEHNNYFQHILLQKLDYKVGNIEKFYFYDMMICILDKILMLSGWDKLKGNEEETGTDYYYALFSSLVEMLIEIVQGTQSDNFSLLLKEEHTTVANSHSKQVETSSKGFSVFKPAKFSKNDPVFECGKALPILLNNIKSFLFNDFANMETIFKVRKDLVYLLLAYMEEYSCPIRIKNLIMNTYNPKTILKSIGHALKAYFMKNMSPNEEDTIKFDFTYSPTLSREKTMVQAKNSKTLNSIKTNVRGKNKKDKRLKRLRFTEKLFNYFTNLYFTDENFLVSPEFEFCSAFYNFFKITILQYEFKESISYMEKIQNLSEEDLNKFNQKRVNSINPIDTKEKSLLDESEYEIFYVIKFFEQISKSVKIQLKDIKEPVLVVYTMSPLLKYLSINSKQSFIQSVNRDNRYLKLYGLMEETVYFKQEIEYNWNKIRKSTILKKAMELDYFKIGLFIYMLVLIINIILLATLKEAGESVLGFHDWRLVDGLQGIGWILTLLDVLIIVFWCLTKLQLNYSIEKEKYLEKMRINGKTTDDITNWDKFKILFDRAIFGRGEINTLIWLFIFVLAGSISSDLSFYFSIALMIVINLSKTLSNIVLSIVLKKRELLWTTILSLLIFYIYSAWGFFYAPQRFVDDLHREKPEFSCSTLLNCWLYTTNEGMRWKAGIGRVLQSISFMSNALEFIFNRWFYDLSFFFFWDVILKHILFGIILDTFRNLRKKQFETDYDKANICFICEIQKDECEKNNINFNDHVENEHNIWEYVNYMITLRVKESQDLNAINSYAKEQLEAKSISWLPSHLTEELEAESHGGGH